MVVADDDGVVIVSRLEAKEVCQKAEDRLANEEEKRQLLAKGEMGLDLYNMRERLAKEGLEYVEDLDTLGSFNGINCKNRG